jgi:hypothetical protein
MEDHNLQSRKPFARIFFSDKLAVRCGDSRAMEGRPTPEGIAHVCRVFIIRRGKRR